MQRVFGAAALSGAAAIWGGMYVVSKYVLDYIPPVTLLVMRFALAVPVLAVMMVARGRWRVTLRDLLEFALLGFIGLTVSVGAQFVGTRLSNAHNGALITSASPAFIVLFAALILRERMSRVQMAALALATAGVVLITGRSGEEQGPNVLLGNLWLVVAAVTWALYTVLSKRATARYPSLVVTTYVSLFGVLFNLPLSLLEARPPWAAVPALAWWGVVYIGVISTALAFYLWNLGFELMDAGTGSVFFFVQPVVGAVLGWLLLDEHLSLTFFIGGAMILAGVALATGNPRPMRD